MSIDKYLWCNGSLITADQFKFSPRDHALTTGDGVFESVAGYRGKVFELKLHIERMLNSANGLGIEVEKHIPMIEAGFTELIKANGHDKTERFKFRLTVTGGEANMASDKVENATPFYYITSMAFSQYPQETKIVTVPWPRNERGALSGYKTVSYGENVKALAFAKKQGGTEALFLNTVDKVCEGTGSNIFWVKDGVYYTSPLSSGCLAGITRHVVIQLAKDNKLPIEERLISLQELKDADEAFLTSSFREVQSIKFVDDHQIKNPNGPLTQKMSKLFLNKALP